MVNNRVEDEYEVEKEMARVLNPKPKLTFRKMYGKRIRERKTKK